MVVSLEKKKNARGNWMKAQKAFGLWCDQNGILKTNETYGRYIKEMGDDMHHIPHYPTSDTKSPPWREKQTGTFQKAGK